MHSTSITLWFMDTSMGKLQYLSNCPSMPLNGAKVGDRIGVISVSTDKSKLHYKDLNGGFHRDMIPDAFDVSCPIYYRDQDGYEIQDRIFINIGR
jgi:hypothetical protein